MGSIVRVVEQQRLNIAELRARMAQAGVTVRKLAETANMDSANVSAALSGKAYLGGARAERLILAARALGLDTPDEAEAS